MKEFLFLIFILVQSVFAYGFSLIFILPYIAIGDATSDIKPPYKRVFILLPLVIILIFSVVEVIQDRFNLF